MSRTNKCGGPKLELKLNLSPTRCHRPITESTNQSTTLSPTSSCLSSELLHDETGIRYSTSPEATSMMLVGCPRCLMYIMLAEDYPKCPKCKSTVLLDVFQDSVKKTKN
ncbi:protein GL2-INTERACTING REPRESSOR 1-like [Rutidosis leptorrhynchoides]|uniref:protein GL2-INTERACTING REPRESSOR 1-like n=1 Tax=Rutidosis leptorrhynchoides TaxID=125765 RepID=UPI003A99BF10